MKSDNRAGAPFDEAAALVELERLQNAIEETRRLRVQRVDEFDAFLRSMREPPAGTEPPNDPVPTMGHVRQQVRMPIAREPAPIAHEPAPIPHPPPIPHEPPPIAHDPPPIVHETPAIAHEPAPTPHEPAPIAHHAAPIAHEPEAAAPHGPTVAPEAAPAHRKSSSFFMPMSVDSDRPMASGDVTRSRSHRSKHRVSPGAILAGAVFAIVVGTLFMMRRPEPVSPAATDTQTQSEPPRAAAPSAPTPAPASAAASPSASPAATTGPASGLQVELVPVRPVWLRVIVDGRKAMERELKANERIALSAAQSITVRAGDAGALRVSVGGQDQGTLGPSGIVVTKTFTHKPTR